MKKNDRNPNNLTREQIEIGLAQLKKWYPGEANNIDIYKHTILANIIDGVEIPSDDPIWDVDHISMTDITKDETPMLSPCLKQIAECGVEGVMLLFLVAGCLNAERFNKFFLRRVGVLLDGKLEYVREITPLLEKFNEAEGAVDKATAFAPIAGKLNGFNLVKVCFDIMKSKSSWADYVLDLAGVIAQIVIWVGSEFIAAIAEFALVILGAAHLTSSSIDAAKVCH